METQSTILDLYAEAYKYENYPPIAGKILGLLFSSNQKYFTFEELQKEIGASKSTVSKALKELTKLGEVSYKIAKGSKRKRVFYIDPKTFVKRLQFYLDGFHMQTQLYKETLTLRSKENKELNLFIKEMIRFNESVFDFIEEKMKESFQELKI